MTYTTESDIEAMADAMRKLSFHEDGETVYQAYAKAALEASPVHAELARMRAMYEAVRLHAIAQDCGRICDPGGVPYAEQWVRSEQYVDGLAKRAIQQKGGE